MVQKRKRKKNNYSSIIIAVLLLIIAVLLTIIFVKSKDSNKNDYETTPTTIESVKKETTTKKSNTQTTTSKKETVSTSNQTTTTTVKRPNSIYADIKYRSTKAKVASTKHGKNLMLLNNYNCLPDDYKWNLVYWSNGEAIPESVRWSKRNGALNAVDKDVYAFAKKMFQDAAAADHPLELVSAYRSLELQDKLFGRAVDRYMSQGLTKEQAIKKENIERTFPGTSEHHSGLCMDVLNKGNQYLSVQFDKSPEFKWLSENAENYGFVLRYPKDKENITEIMYEPWHYRFVGVDNAKEMNRLNMCLEEYIDYLDGKK